MMKKIFIYTVFLFFLTPFFYAQSTSSVRSDGAIVRNGNAIFPFGFYNLHWTQPFDDKMKYLDLLFGAGFNVIYMEDAFVTDFYKFLDKTESYSGCSMILGPSNSIGNGYMDHVLYLHKNHNALLGWSLYDDGDDGRVSVDQIKERHDYTKLNDPNHLTFQTLTGYSTERRDNRASFMGVTDAYGIQIYPIGQKWSYAYDYGGNPLVESYQMAKKYVETAINKNKALITSPQTAVIPDVNPPKYPSADELRNMLYGHLAAGAKGLLAYDLSVDLYENHTDLWNECIAVNNEIQNTLKDVLLEGERTVYYTPDNEFFGTQWEYNNELYVIMGNCNYDTTKQPNMKVPDAYSGGSMAALFSRMNNTMSLSNDRIVGNLPPKEVNVYKISKRNLSTKKEDNNVTSLFNVFPNPIKKESEFYLDYNNSNNWSEGVLEIYNPIGIKIQSENLKLNSGQNTITVSSDKMTNTGVYILNFEIKGLDQKITRKIVIE
jgi:hypothetical protein